MRMMMLWMREWLNEWIIKMREREREEENKERRIQFFINPVSTSYYIDAECIVEPSPRCWWNASQNGLVPSSHSTPLTTTKLYWRIFDSFASPYHSPYCFYKLWHDSGCKTGRSDLLHWMPKPEIGTRLHRQDRELEFWIEALSLGSSGWALALPVFEIDKRRDWKDEMMMSWRVDSVQ